MMTADTRAYDALAQEAAATASSYGTATAAMSAPEDCQAAVQRYASRMDPTLERMQAMSGRMDGAMMSAGAPMHADMQCGTAVMAQELERHRGVACTQTDMAANRAAAQQHVEAMDGFANHMQMRAAEMTAMMGDGGGMMGQDGGMMSGGTGPGTITGASQTSSGGMMSWDHTVPGCTPGDVSSTSPSGSGG
jgi:hypothetical protein